MIFSRTMNEEDGNNRRKEEDKEGKNLILQFNFTQFLQFDYEKYKITDFFLRNDASFQLI